jgi:putative ABC transport system permease protein
MWCPMGRRCSPNDVLDQFLTEAATLSLMEGILGILEAATASAILNSFSTLETTLTGGMIALGFFFSAAVGVSFGCYPARKVASFNPIDALPYE